MTKEEAVREITLEAVESNPFTRCQITSLACYENGDIEIDLTVKVKEDDLHAIREYIRPALEKEFGRKFTLSETLHTCLTFGIHQSYEEVTGKPFTLRMDRKPN